MSPFNIAIEFPVELSIRMPEYTPTPSCGYSLDDVQYNLLTFNGDGEPDDWIEFDSTSHAVMVDLVANDPHEKIEKFKLVATFMTFER